MTALQDINFVGSICSIFGLLISIGVLIYSYFINSKLTSLRQKVLSNENLPELMQDLKRHSTELSDYYDDFEHSIDQIQLKLEEIKMTSERATFYLEGNERKSCTKLCKIISDLDGKYTFWDEKNKQSFKREVWDIYGKTITLIQFLKYYLKDIKKFDNYV